jgi:hypothetical protein
MVVVNTGRVGEVLPPTHEVDNAVGSRSFYPYSSRMVARTFWTTSGDISVIQPSKSLTRQDNRAVTHTCQACDDLHHKEGDM